MHPNVSALAALVLLVLGCITPGALSQDAARGSGTDRLTVIVDAFGRPGLELDWGYSALVEVGGRRILFDAGNSGDTFERNVRALKIDLRRLDLVVISHRHGDHTAGLRYVRQVNPTVKIYAPRDEHFGGPTPAAFFTPEPSLPVEQRYFGGRPPKDLPHGSAWGDIPFIQVEAPLEVLPGIRLLPAVSEAPGMRDLREIALAIDTPSGRILVVGCSHPGLETALQRAGRKGDPIRLLAGGFHWVATPMSEIQRMAATLRDEWKIARIAPGHCTGEPAFKALRDSFGARFLHAGVGTVITLDEK